MFCCRKSRATCFSSVVLPAPARPEISTPGSSPQSTFESSEPPGYIPLHVYLGLCVAVNVMESTKKMCCVYVCACANVMRAHVRVCDVRACVRARARVRVCACASACV
mgnify:CR=1 FL=1|jgi:hypothetical protein